MNDSGKFTSGETYFFRDHGQFDLLRLHLLPELIGRRLDTKKLRLWSAGCASGEEAYSLAILLDMLLPKRDLWDILLIGSDNNPDLLAKARNGRYGKWSFRMVPAMLQQRYFQGAADEWVLDERIRGMVTFQCGDLIADQFPAGEFRDMDLILCRNVFIYFDAETVSAVAKKLVATLGIDGYLMTGHTELIGHQLRNLRSRLFAGGVVYQRVAKIATPCPQDASVLPPSANAPIAPIAPAPAVTQQGPALPQPFSPDPAPMLTMARKHADRGEYDLAEQSCRQILNVSPFTAGSYFLLAQLAQLKGDFKLAAELLEKTLYLDPGFVAAYLELAALSERAENFSRAQTLRHAALDIVRALPADRVVEPYEISAVQMLEWLAQ